jgi:hypothetical protein
MRALRCQRRSCLPLLRELVVGYAQALHAAMRAQEAVHALVEGCLTHALDAEEKAAVTVAIYDRRARREPDARTVFAWEESWWAAQLPAAPARVLLGGAGSGREARWLSAAGYSVHAFEPAAYCLPQLRAAVGARGAAHCASFADLVGGRCAWCAPRYDAVLLGWGAISHVLGQAAQLALLRALAARCPDGPILLSFHLHGEREPERQSRAQALGARAGALIARARSLPAPPTRERFFGHAGFSHIFSERELQQLAGELGRQLALNEGPYPHATLRP